MENINLVNVLDSTGASLLLTKALDADKAETNHIVKAYEEAWNRGESFSPIAALWHKPRTPETETAEMEAMLLQVKQRLQGIVVNKWASCMTREQALTVCNALASLMFDTQIVSDGTEIQLNASAVASAWNKAHPDDQQIIPAPGFEK